MQVYGMAPIDSSSSLYCDIKFLQGSYRIRMDKIGLFKTFQDENLRFFKT